MPDGFMFAHHAEFALLAAAIGFLPSLLSEHSRKLAACCPTAMTSSIIIDVRPLTRIAFSKAKSPASFRPGPVKFELGINLRPLRRSASKCRRRCSPAPTR